MMSERRCSLLCAAGSRGVPPWLRGRGAQDPAMRVLVLPATPHRPGGWGGLDFHTRGGRNWNDFRVPGPQASLTAKHLLTRGVPVCSLLLRPLQKKDEVQRLVKHKSRGVRLKAIHDLAMKVGDDRPYRPFALRNHQSTCTYFIKKCGIKRSFLPRTYWQWRRRRGPFSVD